MNFFKVTRKEGTAIKITQGFMFMIFLWFQEGLFGFSVDFWRSFHLHNSMVLIYGNMCDVGSSKISKSGLNTTDTLNLTISLPAKLHHSDAKALMWKKKKKRTGVCFKRHTREFIMFY